MASLSFARPDLLLVSVRHMLPVVIRVVYSNMEKISLPFVSLWMNFLVYDQLQIVASAIELPSKLARHGF